MKFALYNVSSDHRIILQTAGAMVTEVKKISQRIPKDVDCVISGEFKISRGYYRGDIVGFSWVANCLIAQKLLKIKDEFRCVYEDEDDEEYEEY